MSDELKCEICNELFPSKYHFKIIGICNNCYKQRDKKDSNCLSDKAKILLDNALVEPLIIKFPRFD